MYILVFITVWTVVQTVLTVTFNFYGNRQISTPYKINTPEPRQKIPHKSTHWGLLGKNGWNNIITIFYLYLFNSGTHTGQTRGWIFTRDSSKDVKITQGCAFLGSERCALKFWGVKLPTKLKFRGVNRTFKPERQQFQTLENYWSNHDEIFTGSTHHECALVGGPMAPPTNPRWRRPPSLISVKMSITAHWIKISAPNFMERCITAMRRWPRDQKSKPKVNSRDVIK